MIRHNYVVNEYEARDWCNRMGYRYLGTYFRNGEYILEYDDGQMSKQEEEYYIKMIEKQEEEERKAVKKAFETEKRWIVYSDDGIYSRMYKGDGKNYTFQMCDAKLYAKADAQRTAVMMTRNTKVGRVWNVLQAI